jgi:hypothetical protein
VNQPRRGGRNAPNSAVASYAPPGLVLINIGNPGLMPGATFYRAYGASLGCTIKEFKSPYQQALKAPFNLADRSQFPTNLCRKSVALSALRCDQPVVVFTQFISRRLSAFVWW